MRKIPAEVEKEILKRLLAGGTYRKIAKDFNVSLATRARIGGFICITCLAIATTYTIALFWPALEAIRLWLVAIPVFIAFIAILSIGAWIGWTMATTPPPQPIEDIQTEGT